MAQHHQIGPTFPQPGSPHVSKGTMQPRLRRLYELWRKTKGKDDVPRLSRLSAGEIREWLPNLAIIAVRHEGEYVYRYYGQTFVEEFGVDMTGLDLDSLPASQRAIIGHEYDHAVMNERPTWRVYSGEFNGEIVTYERLILPFSKIGRSVTSLLVAAYESANDGVFEIL